MKIREYLVFGEDILCLFHAVFLHVPFTILSLKPYVNNFIHNGKIIQRLFFIRIDSLYSLTHFVPAIASSISQVCTCLITSPIDRFRTQYWAKYEMIGFVDYVVVIKKLVNY